MDDETVMFLGWNSNANKCAECSDDGEPDPNADVTHCERCGQRIEGRLSLWT